jgi:alkylation response protein AidB-like acyl-CoA dehydrogenase
MTTADSNDLTMIRDSIRKIAEGFDLNYWRKKGDDKEYPWDFKDALAKGGWLGIFMPEQYGGMGLGLTEVGVVLDELGQPAASTPIRSSSTTSFPQDPSFTTGRRR